MIGSNLSSKRAMAPESTKPIDQKPSVSSPKSEAQASKKQIVEKTECAETAESQSKIDVEGVKQLTEEIQRVSIEDDTKEKVEDVVNQSENVAVESITQKEQEQPQIVVRTDDNKDEVVPLGVYFEVVDSADSKAQNKEEVKEEVTQNAELDNKENVVEEKSEILEPKRPYDKITDVESKSKDSKKSSKTKLVEKDETFNGSKKLKKDDHTPDIYLNIKPKSDEVAQKEKVNVDEPQKEVSVEVTDLVAKESPEKEVKEQDQKVEILDPTPSVIKDIPLSKMQKDTLSIIPEDSQKGEMSVNQTPSLNPEIQKVGDKKEDIENLYLIEVTKNSDAADTQLAPVDGEVVKDLDKLNEASEHRIQQQ